MRAFVINLDSATDRWAFIQNSFAGSELVLERLPAIEVTRLQFPDVRFASIQYERFHGRTPNLRELACYLSHLKAIDAFLATEEEHAMIGEDDLVLRPDFDSALAAAMCQARHWNILRLTGLSRGRGVRLVGLCGNYSLSICLSRLKGAGAYVIDRRAASALRAKLLPMRLPFDHALDREWALRLRAAYIHPFPASQTESPFLSSVQPGIYPKLSSTRRILSTYPYQAWNESSRYLARGSACLRFKLFALGHRARIVP